MNGASEEEMNAVLAKATAGDLSQKELDDIVAKAMTSRQVYQVYLRVISPFYFLKMGTYCYLRIRRQIADKLN